MLPADIRRLEDRVLLSAISFSLTGPSSVTEDTSDGDNNESVYTVSYTGSPEVGETVSVDVGHVLGDTNAGDYASDLVTAITTSAAGVDNVSFDGTTLSFENPGSTAGSSSSFAGTATQGSAGDETWNNVSNGVGNISSTFTYVDARRNDWSTPLRLTNFGLNIPSNATVDGIEISLVTTGSDHPDNGLGVLLTKDGTTTTGTLTASTGSWAGGSITAGGAADLWNTTWTAAEVNSANFGLIIETEGDSNGDEHRLYTAEITVSYTEGGGGAPTSLNFPMGITAEDPTESDESYSIDLSNANRTDTSAGTVTIATNSVSTTIVNSVTEGNAAPTVSLSNIITTLPETTDTSAAVFVADIVVSDDSYGTNTLSLSGADAALFEITGNALYLSAGTVLDASTQSQLDVTVDVDDITVGGTPDDSAAHAVTVQAVGSTIEFSLSGPSSVTEDTSDGDNNESVYTISYTGAPEVGETVSVDVAHVLGDTDTVDYTSDLVTAITTAAAGVDNVSFAGTTLSFTNPGSTSGTSSSFVGTATQGSAGDEIWNNLANAVGNSSSTFSHVDARNGDWSTPLRLTNFGLNIPSGATIDGIEVSLATTGSGNPSNGLGVLLTKDGTTTTGTLTNSTGSWAGGSITAGGAADLWNTTWTAAEVNSANFGLIVETEGDSNGDEHRLYTAEITVSYTEGGGGGAPTSLNFSMGITAEDPTESDESYSISLSNANRTDTSAGTVTIATNSVSTTIVNSVTEGNAAPTVSLSNIITTLPETTDTSAAVFVADIVVSDDSYGTNTLSLSGADAALFEITGNALYLTAGTVLDASAQSQLDVTVDVDDTTVGGTPDDSAAHAVTVQAVGSPIEFSLSGPSSVTEDTSDGDNNESVYTISYTGAPEVGETVSVDVAHVLGDTDAADYTGDLVTTITTAAAGIDNVSFDGTTLSFANPGSTSGSSSSFSGTATQGSGGDEHWNNLSNAVGSSLSTFTHVDARNGDWSSPLQLTNFGLNIPSGATIDGIEVSLVTTGSDSPSNGMGILLTKDGTTTTGTLTNSTGSWAGGSITAGGASDLWNTAWTAAEINSANFGLIIETEGDSNGDDHRLYTAEITVSYSTVGAAPSSFNFSLGVTPGDPAESDESYSISLSDASRTNTSAGTATIATTSVSTTIVNDATANAAPTVSLSNTVATLPESTDTSAAVFVADIVVGDDGSGTNVLSLNGDDAALFEINGNTLYLSAGTVLDYETQAQLNVTIDVDDSTVGGTPDDSISLTVPVGDVNDVAPELKIIEIVTDPIPEDTSFVFTMKVASIVLNDPDAGTNTLLLSGDDADLFNVSDIGLYLNPGITLDYDVNPVLDVTVSVDDATIGTGIDDTVTYSIPVTNVNKVPEVTLTNTLTVLPEDADTSTATAVGEIVVTDDIDGVNTLSLSGPDAALFEISGNTLFLKADAVLDFEQLEQLSVTVTIDDPSLGTEAENSSEFEIEVTNVNDLAPTVTLANVLDDPLLENHAIPKAFRVAEVVIEADDLSTVELGLTGDDAALFEVTETGLYLKADTVLDFEANPVLDVTITVDDVTLGTGIDDTVAYTVAVADVNEAPTVSLTNTVVTLAEDVDTSAPLTVADIIIADDALGTPELKLVGPQSHLFDIDGGQLVLKAGEGLDYENLETLTVTVMVYDINAGGTANSTDTLVIDVTNINDVAPRVILSELTALTVTEDTTFPVRLKIADVDIEDDGLGTATLQLTGDDAALFEVDETGLYIAAGTSLDFETNPVLDVTVTVDDVTLGAGIDDSANAMVIVTDVNEAPVVSFDSIVVSSVAEDEIPETALLVADILVDDDGPGTFTLSLSGSDALLFEIDNDSLYLKAGAALDFEANPVLEVDVSVDDAELGAGVEDTVSLTISVTDVTLSAVDDVLEVENTSRGDAVSLDVLLNDFSDVGGGLTIASVTGEANGVITIVSGGGNDTLSFLPDYGFYGTETLTYVVQDSSGNQSTGTAEVTVTEADDANRAPTLTTIYLNTAAGTAQTINIFDAVVDADGDDLTLTAIGTPTSGTLTTSVDADGNTLHTYVPNASFSGTETIPYSVTDEYGFVTDSTIVISVNNSGPLAVPDSYVVESGTTLDINSLDSGSSVPSVLVNDADADPQSLNATLVTSTDNGTLTFNTDGTFVYDPDPGFVGTDTFTYTTSDGINDSVEQTVTLEVTPEVDGSGSGNGVATFTPIDPVSTGPAVSGITTAWGTLLGSFSVNPTTTLPAPTYTNSSSNTTSTTELEEDTDHEDVTTTTDVTNNSNVTTTQTVNPDGSWVFWESYSSSWTVIITDSTGSSTTTIGTYSYTLTAHGDPTYTDYTFTASTTNMASGSFTNSTAGGSMTHTWTATTTSVSTISNYTNHVTGLSIGQQTELSTDVLSVSGSGSYSYDIEGGSVSGSLTTSISEVEMTSLVSTYISTPTGWLITGNGSVMTMGTDNSSSSGSGSATITATEPGGGTRTTNSSISESSSDRVVSGLAVFYALGTEGWYMTMGSGMTTATGQSQESSGFSGSYGHSIAGGSVSGTFSGNSFDSSNYMANVMTTGWLGEWSSTGTGTSTGNGQSSQSSSGSGSYSTTSDNGAGMTSSASGSTSGSNEDSSNYMYFSGYTLLADNTWTLSSGSAMSNGSGSNESSSSTSGTYTRVLGFDEAGLGGTITGSMSSSSQNSGEYSFDESSAVVAGQWVDSGTGESSQEGSSTRTTNGTGNYTRSQTLEDGANTTVSGTSTESGSASSDFQSESAFVLGAGGWLQTSGQGVATGDGTNSSSHEGTGTYSRSVEGGTVSGTSTESGSKSSNFDYTVNSIWSGGGWQDSGSRNDESSASGSSSYESNSGASVTVEKTGADSSSTITYQITEDGEEGFSNESSSESTLDADGEWQLATGDGTTSRNGKRHFESTGSGSYTTAVSGGTIHGSVNEHKRVRDSEFNFTIDSVVAGGEWDEASGTRSDSSNSSDKFDSDGSGSFSSGHSNGGYSTTFTGTVNQERKSDSQGDSSTESEWGANDEWVLVSGDQSGSGSSSHSQDRTGNGSYSRNVDGGSVSGTSSTASGSKGNSSRNTTSTFTGGAWHTSGNRNSNGERYDNTTFTGSGSYTRTVDDGDGGTYTESGTVSESKADNSKVTEDSAYTDENDDGWIQTSGSRVQDDDGHSMLTYSSIVSGFTGLEIAGESFTGTLTRNNSIGVASYNMNVTESYVDGAWQTPQGNGSRVDVEGSGTVLNVSGVSHRAAAGHDTTGIMTIEAADGFTGTLTETFVLNSQGNLDSQSVQEGAMAGTEITADYTGIGVYDRPIEHGSGTLIGGVAHVSASSLNSAFNYQYHDQEGSATTTTGTATVSASSNAMTSFAGVGSYTYGTSALLPNGFTGTANESGSSASMSSSSITYELDEQAGVWEATGGSSMSVGMGFYMYESGGTGNYSITSVTTGPTSGGSGNHWVGDELYVLDRDIPGQSTVTTTYEGSVTESSKTSADYQYNASGSLVDGEWERSGSGNHSSESEYSQQKEDVVTTDTVVSFTSSYSGSSTTTVEDRTGFTELAMETDTTSYTLDGGWNTTDNTRSYMALVTGNHTDTSDGSFNLAFDDADYHHNDHFKGGEISTSHANSSEQYVAYYSSGAAGGAWGVVAAAGGSSTFDVTQANRKDVASDETWDYTYNKTRSHGSAYAENWTSPAGGSLTGGVVVDTGFLEAEANAQLTFTNAMGGVNVTEAYGIIDSQRAGMDGFDVLEREIGFEPDQLGTLASQFPSGAGLGMQMNGGPSGTVASLPYTPPPEETESEEPEEEGSWLDTVQLTLDVAGMVPAVGIFADAANTIISLGRGNFVEAGLNAVAMIPVIGQATKSAQLGVKGTRAVLKSGGKELVETAVEKGLQKAGGAVDNVAKGAKGLADEAVDAAKGAKGAADDIAGVGAKSGTPNCFVAGTQIVVHSAPALAPVIVDTDVLQKPMPAPDRDAYYATGAFAIAIGLNHHSRRRRKNQNR